MEDLGLGTNIVKEGSICHEVHTSSDTKYTKFVGGICSTWKKKNIDWLQVQGDGISDEYMESKRSARGHIRWAWQAIMDAMWPKQSMFENSPFGDEYYERLNMLEEGQKLCKL